MDSVDRFKIEYFLSYISKLKDYEIISNTVKNLCNHVLNPRFHEIINEPVDLNKIFQKSFNDGSISLHDFFQHFNKMLQSIFQYYEPESLSYRAALNLQRYSLEKFSHLNCQDVQFPNALPSVQEILLSIFVETYNYMNSDGKYLSESILKLPAYGWVDGVFKRVETLETIKRRLDNGQYSNLDELQTSLFNVFSRARLSWQFNKDLYKDSVELQSVYINIRNTISKHGTLQSSKAFSVGLSDLIIAVQNEELRHSIDINAESQIASLEVKHHDKVTKQLGDSFQIGDFIYVNPLDFDSVYDCQIMEIHKIITDKDGQIMVYGWQFFKPQDINIYHGHLMDVTISFDEFCLFTLKFHCQELLKCDNFLYLPLAKVVKKCLIVTPLRYSEMYFNGFNRDVYICRYSYRFSNQKFEKLVMEHSQFSFSDEINKDMHYLFDLKVSKRIRQWSILQGDTEKLKNVPLLSFIGSNCVKNIENLTATTDHSLNQHCFYSYQSSMQPTQVTALNEDGFPFEICSTEQKLQLPSLESNEEATNECHESENDIDTTPEPLSIISGLKSENIEKDLSEIVNDEEEFTSDDVNDGVLFIQCNSVVGILKNGDFVYIQSKPETTKFIVHVAEVILSKSCEFMIVGTKFIIQEKVADAEDQVLVPFNEAYWYQQRSIHSVSHVAGRCMVLNFQDYLYLRPSSIPEIDVYLCEFIFDYKRHCLFPLNFGMPELLHQEVIKVKMQRVTENFIFDNIHRRHVIYGKPIPKLLNEIGKNIANEAALSHLADLASNLGNSDVSVKKELDDSTAFVPEVSSADKLDIWQKDLLSWLKEQKRLKNIVSCVDFSKQAQRYSKIYKLSSPIKSDITYFKQKYRNIIYRLKLIKGSRHCRLSKAEKCKSTIQGHENRNDQIKPSNDQGKAAGKFELWQRDLMSWLRKQKQMNNVVTCKDFNRRAYFYCSIYQLGDKQVHIKFFRQEYKEIISNEQLIKDARGIKQSKKKKISHFGTKKCIGNELKHLDGKSQIWQQNLLSLLRDQRRKLGHAIGHHEFNRKSFILYQDLRLEASLADLIVQFKKKYRDIIIKEKLMMDGRNKKFLTALDSERNLKTLSEKECNNCTRNDPSKIIIRKRGRSSKNMPTIEMNKFVKSRELKRLSPAGVVFSNVSLSDPKIKLRFHERSVSIVDKETSDINELKISTQENSEVQNEIIKIWERELIHWLRTKKRLCEIVLLEDFNERALHFQHILKVGSPLDSKVKNFKDRYHEEIMKEGLIKFNIENELSEPDIKSKHCSNGCGFYGSPNTGGLCSNCYKDSSCDLLAVQPKRESESLSFSSSASTSTSRSSSPLSCSSSLSDASTRPPTSSSTPSPTSSSTAANISNTSSKEENNISKPDSTKNFKRKRGRPKSKILEKSPVKAGKVSNHSVSTKLKQSYWVFKKQQFEMLNKKLPGFSHFPLQKIISKEWKALSVDEKLSYSKEIKNKEANNISKPDSTKNFKRKRGRPKIKILEKSPVEAGKVSAKTSHGRTFLEEMEEIERRRHLCIESFKNSDQDITLVREFTNIENNNSNFMKKYFEQLIEFFELPPDDLESYATFKWLQPTIDALLQGNSTRDDRVKERDMNETWLNYGPRLAEMALMHRLKENPLALGEFKQLAMSTPLLQIPKMSLAYENLL